MGILRTDNIAGLGGRNAANGSVYFDGRDDVTALQVIIGGSAADFTFGTGDFTIEFWMNHGATGSYDLLYDGRRESTDIAPMLYLVSGKIRYYTDGSDRITGTVDISHDSWYHIALCRSSGSTKLFLNGVQDGSTYSDSNSYVAKLNRPVIGGEGPNFANNPFGGFLSNLRAVKGTALYTANFTPPTEKLTAIDGTVLLCCQDSGNPTAEATGKEMLGQGGVYYGRRFSNLATNGDLETGDTTGWTNGGCSTFEASTEVVHSGTYSLHCVSDGNGDHVYTTVDLDNTKRYKISAYINCVGPGNSSAKAKMKIGSSAADNTNYESQTADNGAGWQYVEWIGRATSATTYITFNESSSNNVNDWYVDDLKVELWYPEETENILANPTFLTGATGWSFSSTPSGEYTISSNRLNLADTSRTGNAYATQQLFSGSVAEGRYRFTIDYTLTAGAFDAGVGNSNIWGIGNSVASASVTHEVVADDNNSNFRIIGNQHCAGYFTSITLYRIAEPKRINPVPPYGIDAGVQIDGYTKVNSPNYMYFPTGDTSQRGRGRGLFMGGYTPGAYKSGIDAIQIQSLGNSITFGNLSHIDYAEGTSVASETRAVKGGKASGGNHIEYVTIATTGNAIDFGGDLTSARRSLTGISNGSRGVFCGGAPTIVNVMDYITIASTGVNAADFGDLTVTRRSQAAASSPTRGVVGGGNANPANSDVIDYITTATTGNATDFGNLTVGRRELGGCSSSTRGVFACGWKNPGAMSGEIDYITIASTGNATDFGDSVLARSGVQGTSNSIRGIFKGGASPTYQNAIEYVTIATTGNSVDFGDGTANAAVGMIHYGGCSDSHGGLS